MRKGFDKVRSVSVSIFYVVSAAYRRWAIKTDGLKVTTQINSVL